MGLVYYLSYLTYILVNFNFLYAPSITEVSSAFKKVCVGCISNFEDIALILVFWLCDKIFRYNIVMFYVLILV